MVGLGEGAKGLKVEFRVEGMACRELNLGLAFRE